MCCSSEYHDERLYSHINTIPHSKTIVNKIAKILCFLKNFNISFTPFSHFNIRQNRLSIHIGKFYNFHCERILTITKIKHSREIRDASSQECKHSCEFRDASSQECKHSCEFRDVEGAVPYDDTQSSFLI